MNKNAARRICAAAYGPPRKGQVVVHLDGDRRNNDPANLKWGTLSEATRLCYRRLSRRGEHHNQARLTDRDVTEIRRMAGEGEAPAQLALRFRVGRSAVQDVIKRRKWAHI